MTKTFDELAGQFYEIVEELYDSANAINVDRINKNARSLCETFGIDTRMLDDGLCVVHCKMREASTTLPLPKHSKREPNTTYEII